MFVKEEIEKVVRDGRIVAIIRGFAPDTCLRLAEAYAKGGIRLVEVTFNQKAPEAWKDTAVAAPTYQKRVIEGHYVNDYVNGRLVRTWVPAQEVWVRVK